MLVLFSYTVVFYVGNFVYYFDMIRERVLYPSAPGIDSAFCQTSLLYWSPHL